MKYVFAALLLSICLSSGSFAMAADSAQASSSDELNFGDVVNGVSFTGARLVRCSLGLVIGTPIAVLRRTLRSTHDTSKSVAGDNANQAVSVLTEALVLPVGVLVGGVDGLGWSVSNSWKNSELEKPFHFNKEIFSLGSIDE